MTPQGLQNKYAGLLGFGGFLPGANGLPFPGAPHHLLGANFMNPHNNNNNNNFSPSASPTLSDKPHSASPSPSLNENADEDRSPSSSPQPQDGSEAVEQKQHIWDLHYEHAKTAQNKSGDAAATMEGLALLSGAPQRSEGLAA